MPPDAAALLHLVRENLRLVAQLVTQYEVQGLDPPDGNADALVVRKPADVAAYLGPELAPLAQEQLRVVLVDTRHRLMGVRMVYQGTVSQAQVRVGEVFKDAIRMSSTALAVVHNHPSGDPTPSAADLALTVEIERAGELLGIDVLDHVIVSANDHRSLRRLGLGFKNGR